MGLFDFLRGGRDDHHPTPRSTPPGAPRASVTLPLRAAAPGTLDPAVLPAGRPVLAEYGETAIAWLVTEGDLGALWTRLVEEFPRSGLWPLVVDAPEGDPTQPWLNRELDGPKPVRVGAEEVLAKGFADDNEDDNEDHDEDLDEPWRRTFGGLAPASEPGDATIVLVGPDAIAALLLVPVARPADVTAQVGWWGPVNYDLDGADVAAVLRSWEERFGAVPVGIGLDTLTVHAAWPPAAADAEAFAREWYAFCPDAIDQGVESLEALAELTQSPSWWFWWD